MLESLGDRINRQARAAMDPRLADGHGVPATIVYPLDSGPGFTSTLVRVAEWGDYYLTVDLSDGVITVTFHRTGLGGPWRGTRPAACDP